MAKLVRAFFRGSQMSLPPVSHSPSFLLFLLYIVELALVLDIHEIFESGR